MAERETRRAPGQHLPSTAGRSASVAELRHPPRRAFRRLRGSQRVVPLLIAISLLCTFGLATITYIAARVNATAQAETNALHSALIARQLIADQGPGLSISDGQLVVGADNAVYALNGETMLVDRARGLTGDDTTIYQLQGSQLVSVASSLQTGGSARAVGDTLGGQAFASLVGNCGAFDSQSCHKAYSGILTLHGTDYAVGVQPLFDATGAFVGALGTAQTLSSALAPVNQFAIVLLLVALLLAFVCIAGGIWLIGSRSEDMLVTVDSRLDAVAEAATDIERLAQAQIARSNARGRAARELSEQTRSLDALAAAMEQGQSALRDSAGGIWNEMSQPGAAPDADSVLRWARSAAVVSSNVGSSAERARDLCRHLIALMNHLIAENGVATDAGHQMQQHARDLRHAVEGVEVALGERLIARPQGIAALPLVRRMRRWLPSRSLEHATAKREGAKPSALTRPRGGATGAQPAVRRGPNPSESEPLVSESLWLGKEGKPSASTPRSPQTDPQDQPSRPRPYVNPPRPGASGQHPRLPLSQSGQWRLPERQQSTGQQPRPPSHSSFWSGEYPALPKVRPPSNPADSGTGSIDGSNWPNSRFGPNGPRSAFQWRPPSAPRTPKPEDGAGSSPRSKAGDSQIWPSLDFGFPVADSSEHPRTDRDRRFDSGSRWPDE